MTEIKKIIEIKEKKTVGTQSQEPVQEPVQELMKEESEGVEESERPTESESPEESERPERPAEPRRPERNQYNLGIMEQMEERFFNFKDVIVNETKDNLVRIKDDIIVEKDKFMLKLNELISEKDLLISEKDLLISKKDQLISEKDKIIECQLETIQKLIKSHENIVPFKPETRIESFQESAETSTEPEGPNIFIDKHTDDTLKIHGKTFEHKHLIKQVDGNMWHKDLKLWTIPLENLDKLVEFFNESKLKFKVNVE